MLPGLEGYLLTQAAKTLRLEQHVQQLQQEASTAAALEYRCEGLQQEKQQLAQQLQQLKGELVSDIM